MQITAALQSDGCNLFLFLKKQQFKMGIGQNVENSR